jgi:nucleoid-associated protein YgaU
MPLWGKKDTVYSTGKVNCTTAGVVTKESGSIAWTSGNGVKVGQVLTLATDGAGPGQGIIKSINSATEIQLDPEKLDLPGAFTDVDYEIRETPVYEVKGGSFGINQIFGVDVTEAQVARAASGDARKYKPAAAGWVGITTYIDTHGNFRVKSETLVAGGGDGFITADSTDDTKFADS